MAHGDAREGNWRGNWRMAWLANILRTTSEHGVSSITTDDAHTSAASRRLNWRPRRFKWTRPFSLKTKSGFCACAITFQTQSTIVHDNAKYRFHELRILCFKLHRKLLQQNWSCFSKPCYYLTFRTAKSISLNTAVSWDLMLITFLFVVEF